MVDFDRLNRVAQETKTAEIQKKQMEEELQKELEEQEIKKLEEYLYDYLAPRIEHIAELVIRNNGKEETYSIGIDDVVYKYKSPFIRKEYKNKNNFPPVYNCIYLRVIDRVWRRYQKKLTAFSMSMFCWEESGFFKTHYSIRLTIGFKPPQPHKP